MHNIKQKKLLENVKKLAVDESKFDYIFVKDTVKIMAVGTGKTYSCGHVILEQLVNDDNSILVISTMRNGLIDGIILEFAKNLENYSSNSGCINDFSAYIENVRKLKNTSRLLKQLGIVLMTSSNPLKKEDLQSCKVILTNHAYFFPHGHSAKYNKNCYEINKHLLSTNKKVKIIFDEFDQYHKFGISEVQLNFYVGQNFSDNSKIQNIVADHAFKYCRSVDLQSNQAKLRDKQETEDYYYNLPKLSYYNKLESDNMGIQFFSPDIHGNYDFEREVLSRLKEVTEKQYIQQSKYSKKRGKHYFRIVNEISRYELYDISTLQQYTKESFQKELTVKNSILTEDSKNRITKKIEISNDDKVGQLLTIGDTIIIRTQKLEVYKNKDTEMIKRFESPEEVIFWVKNNMSKIEWISLYNSFGVEGKDLYIKKMILSKKQFNFVNTENYYVTATPSVLENLGYNLDTTMQYKKVTELETLDIFVLQNKNNSIGDMKEFFKLLKDYTNIETLAVVDKEDTLSKFIEENRCNSSYKHVNAVKKDEIIDIGRLPSNAKRTNKNITVVYQKGNETQGTNYKEHILMLQDCHCKISSNERIVCNLNGGIDVIDYVESVIKQLTQSTGRICRGEYKYKSLVLFADFLNNESEEKEVIQNIVEEMKKYGFKTNLTWIEKDITKSKEKKEVYNSVLKHVLDRHNNVNLSSGDILYFFDINNLYDKQDMRSNNKRPNKYNFLMVYNFYLAYKEKLSSENNRKIKDVEVIPVITEKFGISERQFKSIKKKYINISNDDVDIENMLKDYSKILYSNRRDFGCAESDQDQEIEAIKFSLDEYNKIRNKKDTIADEAIN